VLVVVDNKTARTFEDTEWSCQAISNGQPVGEESFYIHNVQPNKQTSKSAVIRVVGHQQFDSAECRLLSSD